MKNPAQFSVEINKQDYKKRPQNAGTWARGRGCINTRSLNVPRTDNLVWEQAIRIIKGARLMQHIQGEADGQSTSKSLKQQQARLKQLRQHLRRLRETLANSEANAISDVISEATAGHLRLDLRKRIAAAELSLSACETEIASVKQEKKRTDWMRHFDTKSLDADGLSDETKKQVLQQMVDRIQVFYDPKAETHRLDIHFFDTVNPHVLKSGDLDSENKTVQVKDGTVLIPVVAKKNVPGRVNRKQTNRSKPLKTK